MKSKKTALIICGLFCGLMAFGDQRYLYDNQGFRYDLDMANYTSYGQNICAYNVRVTRYDDTNQTYGTAVLFYHSQYGNMKVFKVSPGTATTYPPIMGIEAKWIGESAPFDGRYSTGASTSYETTLSWEPIYPLPSYRKALNDGLAVNGESAPAPAMTLCADEDISASKGTYRFTASVEGTSYSFIFYVYDDVVLNYFPQPSGYSARALGMIVEVYIGGSLVATTDGIFYGFPLSANTYRTYFAVFPNSAFPTSFSVLCNYYSVSSQNRICVFTTLVNGTIAVYFCQ